MFEVGWSEYLLIFGLALVVLGPEKLPKVAASIGRWVGRARVMARQFRDQLESEAETIRSSVDDVKKDFQSAASDMQSGLSDADLGLQPTHTTTATPAADEAVAAAVTPDSVTPDSVAPVEAPEADVARAIPAAAIGSASLSGLEPVVGTGAAPVEHAAAATPTGHPPFSELPPRGADVPPTTPEGQDERR